VETVSSPKSYGITSFLRFYVMGCSVVSLACAVVIPEETRYLKKAQDHATQEDVQERLGKPWGVKSTNNGESIWTYEVRELEPGSQNTWASMGSWCDEYTLTFDQAGVLRRWTHKSYLHAGEMMPVSCNTGRGVEKPAL
jgi:hypothetical protein